MKQCPRCHQTYSDDQLNFCLSDGEMLTTYANERPTQFADDSPPTMILNEARVTNPTNWPQSPPMQWQPPQPPQQQHMQNMQFGGLSYAPKRDQVLPTVAMIVGIASMVLICCYGGIWLGLPAAILGFLGMRNADRDPERYSGRGMAVAGMVLGTISFLASLVVAIIAIFANR